MGIENSNNRKNSSAVVSLVCGIVALVIAMVPCVGVLALPLAIVSIVFGVLAISASRRDGTMSGMAVGGLTMSIIAFMLGVTWLVAMVEISGNGDVINNQVKMIFDSRNSNVEAEDFESTDATIERLYKTLNSMDSSIEMHMQATDSSVHMLIDDKNGKKVKIDVNTTK